MAGKPGESAMSRAEASRSLKQDAANARATYAAQQSSSSNSNRSSGSSNSSSSRPSHGPSSSNSPQAKAQNAAVSRPTPSQQTYAANHSTPAFQPANDTRSATGQRGITQGVSQLRGLGSSGPVAPTYADQIQSRPTPSQQVYSANHPAQTSAAFQPSRPTPSQQVYAANHPVQSALSKIGAMFGFGSSAAMPADFTAKKFVPSGPASANDSMFDMPGSAPDAAAAFTREPYDPNTIGGWPKPDFTPKTEPTPETFASDFPDNNNFADPKSFLGMRNTTGYDPTTQGPDLYSDKYQPQISSFLDQNDVEHHRPFAGGEPDWNNSGFETNPVNKQFGPAQNISDVARPGFAPSDTLTQDDRNIPSLAGTPGLPTPASMLSDADVHARMSALKGGPMDAVARQYDAFSSANPADAINGARRYISYDQSRYATPQNADASPTNVAFTDTATAKGQRDITAPSWQRTLENFAAPNVDVKNLDPRFGSNLANIVKDPSVGTQPGQTMLISGYRDRVGQQGAIENQYHRATGKDFSSLSPSEQNSFYRNGVHMKGGIAAGQDSSNHRLGGAVDWNFGGDPSFGVPASSAMTQQQQSAIRKLASANGSTFIGANDPPHMQAKSFAGYAPRTGLYSPVGSAGNPISVADGKQLALAGQYISPSGTMLANNAPRPTPAFKSNAIQAASSDIAPAPRIDQSSTLAANYAKYRPGTGVPDAVAPAYHPTANDYRDYRPSGGFAPSNPQGDGATSGGLGAIDPASQYSQYRPSAGAKPAFGPSRDEMQQSFGRPEGPALPQRAMTTVAGRPDFPSENVAPTAEMIGPNFVGSVPFGPPAPSQTFVAGRPDVPVGSFPPAPLQATAGTYFAPQASGPAFNAVDPTDSYPMQSPATPQTMADAMRAADYISGNQPQSVNPGQNFFPSIDPADQIAFSDIPSPVPADRLPIDLSPAFSPWQDGGSPQFSWGEPTTPQPLREASGMGPLTDTPPAIVSPVPDQRNAAFAQAMGGYHPLPSLGWGGFPVSDPFAGFDPMQPVDSAMSPPLDDNAEARRANPDAWALPGQPELRQPQAIPPDGALPTLPSMAAPTPAEIEAYLKDNPDKNGGLTDLGQKITDAFPGGPVVKYLNDTTKMAQDYVRNMYLAPDPFAVTGSRSNSSAAPAFTAVADATPAVPSAAPIGTTGPMSADFFAGRQPSTMETAIEDAAQTGTIDPYLAMIQLAALQNQSGATPAFQVQLPQPYGDSLNA